MKWRDPRKILQFQHSAFIIFSECTMNKGYQFVPGTKKRMRGRRWKRTTTLHHHHWLWEDHSPRWGVGGGGKKYALPADSIEVNSVSLQQYFLHCLRKHQVFPLTSLTEAKIAALALLSCLTWSGSRYCASFLRYGFRSIASYWWPAMWWKVASSTRGSIPGSFGVPKEKSISQHT